MARRIIISALKSSNYFSALRGSYRFGPTALTCCNKLSTSATFLAQTPVSKDEPDDRIDKFLDKEVQGLLKELTGLDYQRVFRKRKIGQKLKEPKYSFMTEEELVDAMNEANAKASDILQMPPVLRPRKPINKILSYDPVLQGLEKEGVTLLFTDITQNVSDLDRLVVARDADGTLRHATWEEREKANKVYFPVPHKAFKTPKMFTDLEVLDSVLARASPEDNVYEFILDRACLQFEPDDPLYISTTEKVYDTVDSRQHYDYLYSTRHYGVMVFYLVRNRKMDKLLMCYIQNERLSEGAKLVSLFQRVFPECKSAKQECEDYVQRISSYINADAILGSELRLHLNAYLEEQKRRVDLESGIQRAHGV